MTPARRKVTDKMRLDWLEKSKLELAEYDGKWFVSSVDDTIACRKRMRDALDVAIRAEERGNT